jgi:hypothetical protein
MNNRYEEISKKSLHLSQSMLYSFSELERDKQMTTYSDQADVALRSLDTSTSLRVINIALRIEMLVHERRNVELQTLILSLLQGKESL